MNQIDRRQRDQLLPQEVALLKSCGGEVRKTDHEALDWLASGALVTLRQPSAFSMVNGHFAPS